ncbi:MAG TPA: hypothetical protein VES20_17410 [Bryobacteraceae bacterium]|nr:hypothetical protein [Bryobacteraceae bacterium]
MATPQDAELILKLYELRRDEKLREARAWFIEQFKPASIEDVMATFASERSGSLRMVASYWEMAAAMVNHGAIDRDLFCDANGEYLLVFAKMEPFLHELRERVGNPRMSYNLEKLVDAAPHGRETVKRWQTRWAAETASKGAGA